MANDRVVRILLSESRFSIAFSNMVVMLSGVVIAIARSSKHFFWIL